MMSRRCGDFVRLLPTVLLCVTLFPRESLSGESSLTFEHDTISCTIKSKSIDGFIYLRAKDIQRAIGFEMERESATRGVSLRYDGKCATMYPENPWVLLDSDIVNVPTMPRIYKGERWFPLPLVNEILGHFLGMNLKVEGQKLVSRATRFKLRKIVVDAGHGGKDPGAVGRHGTYEKDIALAIAKLVAKLLESELGIACVLTRDTDVFIPLGRRARIANRHKADIFLSIHCNAHRKREKSGTEVFFMSPAKTTWARAVEARENASVKYETEKERGEIESILWDLAQTEFLKESNVLSGRLVNSLSASIKSKNRGVKQANFYVLRGVYMPACLVEVEFISNPKWEKKLKTKGFQLEVAKGIAEGMREFKDWYEGRKK